MQKKGLGAAASRRFAKEGYHVLVAGRTAAKVEKVADSIRAANGSATPLAVDGIKEAEVIALWDKAMADDADGAPTDLAVFNMGNNAVDVREMTAQHFEDSWRVGCFAGFLFGREAVRRLAPLGRGTVLFTGASGSLRGRPRFAAFNATKGGLRLLVQSLAREFGPQGLHIAHAIIDGGIEGERLLSRMPDRKEKAGADGLLNIEAIADSYWHLHTQHRSAWTHEIDLGRTRSRFRGERKSRSGRRRHERTWRSALRQDYGALAARAPSYQRDISSMAIQVRIELASRT